MQLLLVIISVLVLFLISVAILYSNPVSRAEVQPLLQPGYMAGFGLLLSVLVGGAISQLVHVEKVRKKRQALMGDAHTPDPLTVKLPVAEALSRLEQCLVKVKEEDTLWTVENSDPQKGEYRASAYTYVAGSSRRTETDGYSNYVYIDAKFVSNPDTAETEVKWSYSYSALTGYVPAGLGATPRVKGATGKTVELINKANDRIRWAYGFPIIVGEKVCQPTEGAVMPVEK